MEEREEMESKAAERGALDYRAWRRICYQEHTLEATSCRTPMKEALSFKVNALARTVRVIIVKHPQCTLPLFNS